MRRVARISLAVILSLAVAILTAWAGLALWYRLPVEQLGRAVACALFVLFGCGIVVALFSHFRIKAFVLFLAAFAVILVWWSTIKPSGEADWAPEVSRQVTGKRDGNLLTLKDVRAFEWRSDTDFTEHLDNEDLRSLQRPERRPLHVLLVRTEIAHVIMSFGFAGG